ncbi:hypothetical protein [Streptomyces sp. NBC_00094]|uniref:hypothetical protein n=1 Tax=Streptomyces sp. NBC_00094 TaxID=2903620 RepID=UPI002253A543|nr:hypothetical protein [Streptomyces sp. NBC_00094]MCX5393786.1 hypothetical protein [Streptomyces sp. NBC_00094]
MVVSAPWDSRSGSKDETNTLGGNISTAVRKRADKLKAGDYVKGTNNKPVEILSIEEGVNQDGKKYRILRLYPRSIMVVKDWRFLDTYPARGK